MKNFDKFLLFTYISYISIFILIFISGITGVFAAEQKTGLGFLNNSSVYISNNKGADIQLTRQTVNNVNMDIKSIVFVSNYNFQANTIYEYEIEFHDVFLKNVDKATILSNNGICTLIGLSGLGEQYTKVRFTCSSATSSITIGLSNSNDNNITDSYMVKWNSIYLWSISDNIDLGPIINNQSQNTQDILNNNNQNTQDIIDSNKETQDVIKDQFNSCRDSYNLLYTPYTVNNKLTDTAIRDDYFNTLNYYVSLQAGKTYTFGVETDGNYGGQTGSDTVEIIFLKGPNFTYFIPMGSNPFTFIPQETGDYYIRYDINQNGKTHSFWNFQVVEGSSIKKWEQAGTEICQNKIDETNDKLNDLNNSLNNSNSSGATNDASNFFSNFTTDTFGLTSIITAPLSLINTLTSSSCSTLNLPIPYLDNKYLELPCMSSIYSKYFGSFFNIYQTITFGIVAYWVIVRIFNQVKDFKNPDHDEIEVLDL